MPPVILDKPCYTADDVMLLPRLYDGEGRRSVDLAPRGVFSGLSIPIIASNMNGTSGSRMAECLARAGGVAVLTQDVPLDKLRGMVNKVKAAPVWCDKALTCNPDDTVITARGIVYKRSAGVVVIIDRDSRPIGIVTPKDWEKADDHTPLGQLMSTKLVTVPYGMDIVEAFEHLDRERAFAAPVLYDNGQLIGVVTQDDLVLRTFTRPAVDTQGRLLVAAAMGINGGDRGEHARQLLEMGIDYIFIDTAHGHQAQMAKAIRQVRDAVGADFPLIAGNVCTADGVNFLIDAGIDSVKVGIGPAHQCETRVVAGVGMPQLSAVITCAEVARKLGKEVMADGAVRKSADFVKYVAAGASTCMVGTLLAGTWESPGNAKQEGLKGPFYKETYGMASAQATTLRYAHLSPYERAVRVRYNEGASGSKAFLREGLESVARIVTSFAAGAQSGTTYQGYTHFADIWQTATFVVQTASGGAEMGSYGKVNK